MVNEAAKERDLRILIIGAGMAGILSAIKLHAAGYSNYAIYEKADRLGGTWRENTYPGLACDVPAHLYTYSFEPNPTWTRTFAPGPEIQSYFQHVSDKHSVTPSIRFGEEVTKCEFLNGRWQVETNKGTRDQADVILAATGVLHHPKVADIPGLDTFEGARFHSARWDHNVALEGKRVGVVGTGSTAIQITTALVDKVRHFDLFQRTAQWVMPIEDVKYSAEQKAAFRTDAQALDALRAHVDKNFQHFANAVIDADSPEMKQIEDACAANLENNVRDPELREKLRPNYRAGCKRLIFSPNLHTVSPTTYCQRLSSRASRPVSCSSHLQ